MTASFIESEAEIYEFTEEKLQSSESDENPNLTKSFEKLFATPGVDPSEIIQEEEESSRHGRTSPFMQSEMPKPVKKNKSPRR